MKLEAQICSLELAKRIYELGVKQESEWIWAIMNIGAGQSAYIYNTVSDKGYHRDVEYSAYTVAELGEMLPDNIFSCPSIDRKDHIHDRMYYCKDVFNKIEPINANTEANARAKMLIYLIENKLLEVKK